jgi:hypothetical protein
MPTTGHTHYWACPLLGTPTTGHTHYWACPLTDGIVLEEKILVEVISRLFCHSSSQAGTELLTQSIIHVIYIEMTLQHQVCRLLVVAYNTRGLELLLPVQKTGAKASLVQTGLIKDVGRLALHK